MRVTSSSETLTLARSAHSGTGATAGDSDVAVSARERPRLAEGVVLTPQGLSVAHLDRLVGEGLLAVAPRLPWAQLLRRTYGFDVLACAGCGGRLRLLTAITDKAVARAILTHLGRPADELRARTRDPTVVHDDLEDDWDRPDGAEEPPSVVWSE